MVVDVAVEVVVVGAGAASRGLRVEEEAVLPAAEIFPGLLVGVAVTFHVHREEMFPDLPEATSRVRPGEMFHALQAETSSGPVAGVSLREGRSVLPLETGQTLAEARHNCRRLAAETLVEIGQGRAEATVLRNCRRNRGATGLVVPAGWRTVPRNCHRGLAQVEALPIVLVEARRIVLVENRGNVRAEEI